jgi:carboxyl-terminal processing protease
LTGLFIKTGPVVQVKNAFGEIEVEEDTDPGLVYSGPLAVLVDRSSASASEIFAGAIQDHGRGIIIGEPTFGKGTVQTLVDLNRFVRSDDARLGKLRLTMAQFFRVNGGSTQYRGVVPDIVFPTATTSDDHGERSLDNALPWAEVRPISVSSLGLGDVGYLHSPHKVRISKDPGFKLLVTEEKTLEQIQDKQWVSLMEEKRKEEWDRREQMLLDEKNRFRVSQGLDPIDEKDDKDEEPDEEETEITKRIELNESARILADYIRITRPRSAMSLQTGAAGSSLLDEQ